MHRDDDARLVHACLTGDRRAFGELVQKYEKKLYNVAYRVVNDSEDAMDATQAAFVKAYEKLDSFDPSYKFFSWLYRILLNESLTLVNKRKRFEQLDANLPVREKDPEQQFDALETNNHVQAALMHLKVEYRTVIVLKHFQGLSYREIGAILDVPEKTVKSRLFTARCQLRDILSKRGVIR